MKRTSTNGRFSMGFTLVELMTAITIGLIVLGGAATVMVGANKNYKVQEDLARIQENARFAMEFLAREIRMAGYFGCMDNVSPVVDHVVGGAGDLFDTSNPIEGSESAANWAPTGVAAPANIVAGTDGITVRYLDPSTALNIDTPFMGQPAGNIKVELPPSGDTGLVQGDIIAVTDCATADVFQISNSNPNAGVMVHNTGTGTSPGNANQPGLSGCPGANGHCLSKVYEDEAQILKLAAVRYFIGTTANGNPALFREQIVVVGGAAAPGNVEMVEGIENMQILYGEDFDGNGVPDQFVNAAAVTNWGLITGVRVGLSAASVDELGTRFDEDHGDYDIDRDGTDDVTDPGDRRRRRIFTMTVLMRNLQ